ncbi:MAG: 50S ribosomal protein L20 [Elusimicrobia bacterium]|nr:50S ribosomal protein L20 [Elusimicrobiota bacterium]MBD3411695.1 50S ribosomal protein L20 [Elusimicrobiota bacterium]
MPRVPGGSTSRKKQKKYFRTAKGYYSDKGRRLRQVKQQVEKSLVHAYRGRKQRKRNFRRLWIQRINSAVRQSGMTYSQFMHGLKKAGIAINRKMLAECALHDSSALASLIESARQASS